MNTIAASPFARENEWVVRVFSRDSSLLLMDAIFVAAEAVTRCYMANAMLLTTKGNKQHTSQMNSLFRYVSSCITEPLSHERVIEHLKSLDTYNTIARGAQRVEWLSVAVVEISPQVHSELVTTMKEGRVTRSERFRMNERPLSKE